MNMKMPTVNGEGPLSIEDSNITIFRHDEQNFNGRMRVAGLSYFSVASTCIMGSSGSKPPFLSKETSSGEGHGLRYAVSSMQGWRKEMEVRTNNHMRFLIIT